MKANRQHLLTTISAVRAHLEISQLSIPIGLVAALANRARDLRFTHPQTVYCCVDADYRNVLVGVVGDGANGAYEWFIWDEDRLTLRTSDCGYGCMGVALCSGLVEAGAERANGDHDLVLDWRRK